jgi:hypothetical protein
MPMKNRYIELDFGTEVIYATLFDTPIAKKFHQNLPITVALMQWGAEFYGSIVIDLGEDDPKADIPPGGIAYTQNGNYVCIFFGQKPAWAVEHIGQIMDEQWRRFRACLKTPSKRLFENYLFYPISVLSEEFNPQNTMCIPPVKFFFRLELEQTKQFSNSL